MARWAYEVNEGVDTKSKIYVGISLLIIASLVIFLIGRVNAQDAVLADLTARLKQQGVPIVSVSLVSRIPFTVGIVVQSSGRDLASPDDPIYQHIVVREATLAQQRGYKVDLVQITVIDNQGKVIISGKVIIPENTIATSLTAEALDNPTVASLLRQELSTYGMSIHSIDVSSDSSGVQQAIIDLQARDLQQANSALPMFMFGVRTSFFGRFNDTHHTNLKIVYVNLNNSTGERLLKYVNDLQLRNENWWQAPGLTQEWFPHPPVSIPPAATPNPSATSAPAPTPRTYP